MTIQATVTRSGRWWSIDFTVDGREYHTQARTLEGIEPMVRDALDMMGVTDCDVTVARP